MNNNVEKEEIKEKVKTPISVMLDMARSEIGNHTFACMQNNHIPPSLMVYVLKDILLGIYQMKADQMSEEFVEMQKILNSSERNIIRGDSEENQEG